MKNLKFLVAFTVMLFLGITSISGQVDSVRFQIKYDTALCRYDAYVIITKGSAYTPQHRAQFNSSYSIVVPTGSSFSIVQNHNPIKNNFDFNGTDPTSWTISSSVFSPAAQPENDFYFITPSISPTSYYDSLNADLSAPLEQREVKLFSFTATPVMDCAVAVRPFETGEDPDSEAPGMGGGDFTCGFTIGGFAQKYDGNFPTEVAPSPVLSAQALCAVGLEIDLSASTSGCQEPLTYSWTGPSGYTSSMEDVAIAPANSSNNGTYKVVVTDNFGCQDSIEIDAIAKPDAGIDQDGCAGGTIDLQGAEPTTGSWSADTNNPVGATLNAGVGGAATVVFDDAANGAYTFIYTNDYCSDSMVVNVSNADAGPDPNTVGCFSQGSTSLAAVGTGMWSVANTSAGTATLTDPSNPSTTVTNFSDPGTYFLVWTVGICTDTVTLIVNDECDCVIGNNILPPFNPSNICGTSGNILIDGGTVTLSGSYLWEYRINGGTFNAAPGTNNTEDYTTQDLTGGTHSFRRIFTNDMGIICSDTSNTVTLTVADMPGIPANLSAIPNPVCLGTTVDLSVDPNPGATFTWSASSPNAGLTNATTNTTVMNATAAGVYTIEVFQTVNGCPSDPATIDVTVNPTPPTPNNGSVTANNPSSCGGTDGSIELTGYLPNELYTVDYTASGIPQSVMVTSTAGGVIVIGGLSAGTYSNITITNSSNCSSGTFTGNRSLSDPNPPPAPEDIAADPSPECLGSPITITVTNNPGATYNWSSPSPDAGLGASTTNSVIMMATAPGLYLVEVTQTVGGCTSSSTGISVLVNGTPPTPDGTTVAGNDPSFCGGSDGSITISGLNNLSSYIVDYTDDGTPVRDTLSTSTGGVLTIPNLSEGVYTNFSLSNFTGCTSGVYPGPVNLSDPNSPPAPSNLAGVPNPACLGDIVNLSVDPNAGATFNWMVSSVDATLGGGSSNTNTLNSATAGVYTINVSQTVAGCTSPAASLDVTFLNIPPDFSDINSTNPTSCGGTDGTITLSGLEATTTYTLNYTVNNTPISGSETTDGSGSITITGLSAGVYEDFQVINAGGCSNTLSPGPINLVDPNAPAAPTGLSSDPGRVCLGGTFDLSVDNTAGATYTWSASPAGNGLISSSTSTTTMTPTVVGSFNVSVFQTIAGCSSPAAMISVIVDPLPAAPDPANISSTNPSVCAGMDGSITIGGYEPFRSFTINYNYNGSPQSVVDGADANGDLIIPNLASGSYTDFTITDSGGCESLPYAGPVNLVDPGAPSAPENLVANPNPSCLGTTVSLSVTNDPSATYTWSASSPNAGLVASTTNSTTMLATVAGTYSISVIQEIAGCTSPPAVIDVIVHEIPTTPDANDVIATDPSACGLDDGMISFGGFLPNTTYTIEYWFNGNTANAMLTSDANGVLLITDLALGNYTDFVFINPGNCPSDPYSGPITLVGPAAPDAPSGLTASPNPICMGGLVQLSVDNAAGASYTWSASSPNAGLVSSTTSMTSMQALQPGVYTISVYLTLNGCNSAPSTIDVIVNELPATPDPANINSTNPSACSANDGTIEIGGYTASSNYILHYDFNGGPTFANLTADGQGVLLLNDLGPGMYSNFYVETEEGCISGTYAGPITLLEPNIPDAPLGLVATPNPVCLGNAVSLFVEDTQGATFNWMISSPNGGLNQSASNTNTMMPTVAGTYTVSVSQTIAGCTSPITSIEVHVRETCLNPDFGVTYDDEELTGDLSTNDMQMAGSTYGNPTVVGSNPDATMPVVNPDGTYTFTSSTVGEYSYLVEVCKPNQTGLCDLVALEITVLDQESSENPPVANHDYIGVVGNQATVINILSNDRCETVPNCSISTPTIVNQPTAGAYNVGTSTYTPNNGFVGRDSFRYEICQTPVASPINCDQEWVYINVFPSSSNVFTNAMDDYAETPRNIVLTASVFDGVRANDNDPAGMAQVVTPYSASVPGKGDIVLNDDGSYTFTPALDFYGPVDFAYQVCRVNNGSICDNATLHILVQPIAATGSIGDFVWMDSNGNGLQDGGEQGIGGMIVKLFDNQDQLYSSTITDASGYYLFENIPLGRYYLEFVNQADLDPTQANVGNDDEIDSDVTGANGPNTTNEFEIFGGDYNLTIDAGFYQCVKIGELVWYDVNENDVFDDWENGINGLRVLLWRLVDGNYVIWEEQLTGHKPGTPSDDGWYQFCAPPGTYYVQVIMPPQGLVLVRPFIGNNPFKDSDINHANGTGTTSSFTLANGGSKLDIGAGYYPMAQAGNLVWLDENYNGIQDSNEERIAGVVVQAYDANTNEMVGEAITESDGTYMIDYLDKREVYLKFTPPAGYHATFTGAGNDFIDSDVDHSYGLNTTRMFSLQPGDNIESIDMGILNGVLPVTWVDIKATNSGDHHTIDWETSEEVNVKEFIVERRLEGEFDFTRISIDQISSLNLQKNKYTFEDHKVNQGGIYYYRIKQIDFDGKFSYSNEVSLRRAKVGDVKMFPNPSNDFVDFSFELDENVTFKVEVYSNGGKMVKSYSDKSNTSKLTKARLHLDDISPGVYNVVIYLGSKVIHDKLIKI